jgi:hypothetical protein
LESHWIFRSFFFTPIIHHQFTFHFQHPTQIIYLRIMQSIQHILGRKYRSRRLKNMPTRQTINKVWHK